MHSTAIDRRCFLGVAVTAVSWPLSAAAVPRRPVWLAANVDAAGQYALGAFDSIGQAVFEVELPGRGHGISIAPDGHYGVVVARRPGTFAAVVDLVRGRAVRWLETPPGHHFHGHGAFSGDCRLFFTTENDYRAGQGVIGVWDATDGFRRAGEFSSHGIEPHDIRLLPDGHTLVVANGGILTHPDSGRARLNLDAMDSSLVYLDSRTGALLGQWRVGPDLRLLSIRHLSVNGRGDVAIGLQHQGPESEIVPVFGLQRGGGDIRLLPLPADRAASVRNYCGSIALDASGRVAAASYPHGGLISFWNIEKERFLAAVELADGCGVAAGRDAGTLIATSGRGGGVVWKSDALTSLAGEYISARRWDNHAAFAAIP